MKSPSNHSDPVAYDDTPVRFNNVMIDIETMSLHKHKALILSVGMIEFDPSPPKAPRFGVTALIIPTLAHQIFLGRRVDAATQKFWRDQSPSASKHWREAESHCELDDVCRLVRTFCEGRDKIWANGTQFDLCNLEGLADDLGSTSPLWHYQAPRDMRTFCRETPQTRTMPLGEAFDIPGVPHEPVYDCISQSWQVWGHHADIVEM